MTATTSTAMAAIATAKLRQATLAREAHPRLPMCALRFAEMGLTSATTNATMVTPRTAMVAHAIAKLSQAGPAQPETATLPLFANQSVETRELSALSSAMTVIPTLATGKLTFQ